MAAKREAPLSFDERDGLRLPQIKIEPTRLGHGRRNYATLELEQTIRADPDARKAPWSMFETRVGQEIGSGPPSNVTSMPRASRSRARSAAITRTVTIPFVSASSPRAPVT